MGDLKIQGAVCPRCERDYGQDVLEAVAISNRGYCQLCRAELSGKFATGRSNALDDLIAAARGLRQASKDYEDSNDCGEMYYAERISGPVDLLIDALDNYERGNK